MMDSFFERASVVPARRQRVPERQKPRQCAASEKEKAATRAAFQVTTTGY
jgi:hypothetical protein